MSNYFIYIYLSVAFLELVEVLQKIQHYMLRSYPQSRRERPDLTYSLQILVLPQQQCRLEYPGGARRRGNNLSLLSAATLCM